jgi:hypothetical protein
MKLPVIYNISLDEQCQDISSNKYNIDYYLNIGLNRK